MTKPLTDQQMTTISEENAEQIAIAVLGFLGGEPDRLAGFLALTGLGPEDIRSAAGESAFLAGVLDHLLSDESLLLVFAAHSGIDATTMAQAKRALGGSFGMD